MKKKITKHNKHDHFWINNGVLYESYSTIRGLRFLSILEVPHMSDNDRCSEEVIKKIEEKYL